MKWDIIDIAFFSFLGLACVAWFVMMWVGLPHPWKKKVVGARKVR